MKEIVILGGPNGAGKTTAARVLLPESFGLHAYLNADEIAREISPQNVDAVAFAAGPRMIERMQELVNQDMSFAFETTCAGKSYLPMLERCKSEGWQIRLLFLWLPSLEIAAERIAQRVREGGHGVPFEVIARRYEAGARNMRGLYLPLANDAEIYDNSARPCILIAEKSENQPLLIHDEARWARMLETKR
jgi:predicted ABC-type ATPase